VRRQAKLVSFKYTFLKTKIEKHDFFKAERQGHEESLQVGFKRGFSNVVQRMEVDGAPARCQVSEKYVHQERDLHKGRWESGEKGG
jgi:hypothetical protein